MQVFAIVALCALQIGGSLAQPSPSVAVPNILLQDVGLGNYTTITTNNKIFLPPPNGTSQRSLCNQGPSVWCQPGTNNINVCGVANTTVGVCGYATTQGNCTLMTVQQFCNNATLKPLQFNGGLNGAPQGNLGLLVLALYWAPTSCSPTSGAGGGFCSDYTVAGTPAATNLMLHGMWPDTGSLYVTDPEPPLYTGAYQGWTQYCSGAAGNFSQCSVNGGLCSWSNATSPFFSQSNYESCMRATNVTQCQVEETTVQALMPLMQRYAPGYLGSDRTFVDHEFMKHGSCIGGYLTSNKTAFFERGITWASILTAPGGSAAADLVQSNVGKNITVASMLTALGRQGNPQCTTVNGVCQLSEIWYCLGVDAAGFPTTQIDCPSGSQLGTCDPVKCNDTILIPAYPSTASAPSSGSSSTGRRLL